MNSDIFLQKKREAFDVIKNLDIQKEFKYGLHIRFDVPQTFTQFAEDTGNVTVLQAEKSQKLFNDSLWNNVSPLHSFTQSRVREVEYISISKNGLHTIDINHEDAKMYCISVEKHVHATLFFHITKESPSASFMGVDIRVIAEPHSYVKCVTVQQSENTHILSLKQSYQKTQSRVEWFDLQLGGLFVKSDILSHLQEEGSSTIQKVLYAAKKTQAFDLYTAAIHANRQTESDILTRGVIGDSAKALSQGLVKIEQNAWNSQGYETQDALLLSDTAEADAIPNLEIHNHDVSCSHGSTVGKIDEEQLFYMRSRGLPLNEAKLLIVKGYFTPILEQITDTQIQESIEEMLDKKLV
ncbi:MAG: SufD family Fe-S cluster assembly protein [Candidatus Woesearchaeota archaeon]